VSSITDEVAELRGTRPATIKDLLTNRTFARLLAAMSVSSFGDWVGFVAVTSIVAGLGGGTAALAVSGVMIARTLPAFVFGPIAGSFVDRFNRKQIMIIADIGRAGLYLSMAFLNRLWAIYLLSFVIECLSLLWSPARDASLPNIVPRRQLANANSLVLVSAYATLPIGGAAFAVLVGVSKSLSARIPILASQPESLALVFDAATFLFSAAMVAGITLRSTAVTEHEGLDMSRVWRDTRDGLRFLREDSIAAAMTGGIAIAFGAVGAVLATGPVFVATTVHGGKSGWGLVVTAFGVGMALGMVSATPAARVVDRDRVFVWSLLAAAGTLIVMAAMPNLSWTVVFTVWLGAFCGLAWVSGYTVLQENVADEFRGRTFAALTTLSRMVLFISLALFPLLAQLFDWISNAFGGGDFYIGGQRIDVSGPRLALWTAGLLIVAAALNTRRLLTRYRLSRPVSLSLVPERIRELLLDPATGSLDARAEAMLFAAARAQTVASVIRPALAEGKVVICDRYVDSSLAYQGSGRGLGETDILSLNVWGTQGLFPDLVILLHIEPELGLARSSDERDRMEQEGGSFLARVADAYLRIAEEHPERFVVIDAARDPAEVFDDVRAAIDKALRDRHDHDGG
jgi:dTMP kinase